jgi:hypothetical protein
MLRSKYLELYKILVKTVVKYGGGVCWSFQRERIEAAKMRN